MFNDAVTAFRNMHFLEVAGFNLHQRNLYAQTYIRAMRADTIIPNYPTTTNISDTTAVGMAYDDAIADGKGFH